MVQFWTHTLSLRCLCDVWVGMLSSRGSEGVGGRVSVIIAWQKLWCHRDGPVTSDSLSESPRASLIRGWEGRKHQWEPGAECPEGQMKN